MNSFTLKDINGAVVPEERTIQDIHGYDKGCRCEHCNKERIFNKGVDAQCSVRVRFNREKVAKILYWRMTARDQHGAWDDAGRERDWKCLDEKGKYYHIADAIISAGAELLEVEK